MLKDVNVSFSKNFMLDFNTFEIGLLEIFLLTLWNGYFKKYFVVFLFIILIVGKLISQYWNVRQISIQFKDSQHQRIWIEGTIYEVKKRSQDWLLVLSNTQIRHLNIKHDKIFVQLLDTRKRSLYRGKKVLVSGTLEDTSLKKRELHLVLSNIRAGLMIPEQTPLKYFWESLRLQLANRASFYLSESSIQLYLPLVLGMKSYGQTYDLFRSLGLSHLLVVSGLHAGLFFFGVRYLIVCLSKWLPDFFVSRFRRWLQDGFSFFILLTYVFLLGFPAPALRATVGIGVFLLTKYIGISANPLHALATVAACFLLWNPQWIADLSFQLSFVATSGLLMFRNLYLSTRDFSLSRRVLIYCINSLFASVGVLLMISPLLLKIFETVSLAPLWLNALMTPLLAFFVLPVCVVAFVISMIFLHSLPFSWLEVNAFALAEWVLERWAGVLQSLGGEMSYAITIGHKWTFWDYTAYYTFLALLIWIIQWFTSYKRTSPKLKEI